MSQCKRKKHWKRRLFAMGMSVAVAASIFPTGSFAESKAAVAEEEVVVAAAQNDAGNYELQGDIQGSNILHCWNWSYATIEAHLPLIAECGYTAVQTSPAQQPKDYNYSYVDEDTGENITQTGDTEIGGAVGWPKMAGSGNWWKVYQPVTFDVCDNGNSWMGTKAELESLCAAADQYGIKVIVDVVANHMGNIKGWQNSLVDISPQVGEYWNKDMMTDESYWHINDLQVWMSDGREHFTQGSMGMPDLNTANKTVQKYVYEYLDECIDCGVDGFRFDAAKHIETPDDGSFASDFWPTVLNEATSHYKAKTGGNLYVYGEILNTVGDNFSINSYTKYMSVTDNSAGNQVMSSIRFGSAASVNLNYAANKSVLWAESHDTYMNESSSLAPDVATVRTWAVVGNKKDAASLFFVRPYYSAQVLVNDQNDSFNNAFYKEPSAKMGECSTYVWASKEVAAINHFNNRFAGSADSTGTEGDFSFVRRGNGMIIANFGEGYSSSCSVRISSQGLPDGTYTDEVSGNTFEVSGGTITGNIDSEYGIAVIYQNVVGNPTTSYPISVEKPQISATTGNGSIVGEKEITYTVKNATSATYSIDGATEKNFEGSVTLNIGTGLSVGDTCTVKITAKNEDGTTTQTYTYTISENKPVLSISPDDGETFSDDEEEQKTLSGVSATDYEGMYDGESHSLSVSVPTDSKVSYGTKEGDYNLEDAPSYKEPGEYTVYFKVTKNGYKEYTGKGTVTIYAAKVTTEASEKKYITFESAAAYANISGSKATITLYADVEVTETTTLHADVTVKTNNNATLVIAKGAVLQGGILAGKVENNGSLVNVTITEEAQVTGNGTIEEKEMEETPKPTATTKVQVTESATVKQTATPTASSQATPSGKETPVPSNNAGQGNASSDNKATNAPTQTPIVSNGELVITSMTLNPALCQVAGKDVKVTVEVSGGASNYTFSMKVYDESEQEVTSYTETVANNRVIFNWTPQTTGNFHVEMTVTDATGSKISDSKGIVIVEKKLTALSLKASKKTIKKGKRITFTAKASGGKKSYKYRFVVYNAAGKKVKSSGYKTKKTFIWKTTKKGTYKVTLTVKDATGSTATKTIKKIRVK